MLFDPRPKTQKKDLFGRDEELNTFLRALRSRTPLILLLGIWRVGKTSLLKVGLSESGEPYIFLDMRKLDEEGYAKSVLYRMIEAEINRILPRWRKLINYIKRVKGVSVSAAGIGGSIQLDWGRDGVILSDLVESLNSWVEDDEKVSYFTLAFDEAQLLRNMVGGKGRIDFRSLIAYIYDNLKNIKVVLTGSEIGLLMDFLQFDKAGSILYGRYKEEIILKPFTQNLSREFLVRGFKEANLEAPLEVIDYVIEKLDGIPGWLTSYGYRCIQKHRVDIESVEDFLMEAGELIREKFDKLERKSRLYILVLKAISMDFSTWKGIKMSVEAWLGRPIHNAQITRIIKGLVKMGIIEKVNNKYIILDPIIGNKVRLQ
jgi:hypothetical protein